MLLLLYLILTAAAAVVVTTQDTSWYSYCQFKGINSDILTCGRHRVSSNQTTNETTTIQRTLPYITSDWFTYDLAYMLQNNEVLSNFNNTSNTTLGDYEELEKSFKIIELINFGIEILSKNAFEKFTRLKVLRLNSNLINTIDFSSFLTNQSTTSESSNDTLVERNQLIELDLSNNRIKSIKIENLMYFENLKILNLSHNYIKSIDLKLISLIAPNLQVLDVADNYLQKFNLLNFNQNQKQQQASSQVINYFYSIQLTFNYLLKDLIYINLSGNLLTSVVDLFSLNSYLLANSHEFCTLAEVNSSYFRRNSPIHLNIKDNQWKCDCSSFNLLISIVGGGGGGAIRNDSCLTSATFKRLNLFSISQHQNIELLKNLNCSLQLNETNWLAWYTAKCADEHFVSTTAATTTKTTAVINNWVSTKFTNTTIKMLKYDISAAFYWVSSVCVAIVTLSCLFIAWFYCWKRYRHKHRAMLDTNSAASTNPICQRANTARCMQRRNIYLINSQPSIQTTQMMRTAATPRNMLPHSAAAAAAASRNVTGLYYISLNRDQHSSVEDNSSRDDEPPNYYEAVKHNSRYPTNKNRAVTTAVAPSTSVLNINNNEESNNGQSTDV